MELNGYRIVMLVSGRWRVGITSHNTQKEAEERRQQLIGLGISPKNVEVKSEKELFTWEG